ncbi:acyl-CoA dehydrogenase family protein [Nocardia sp. NBC_01503]|uniref:acyl-CoA dehydrogenase family protein n=1 Tax=Nocardia sp. NBC_01503 TaxID=2975997 RepID=UPI002E7B71E2|nr:acyl-CoA dehydrogenase family protein [Nocardia sp. NBC_01503]WTL31542.1 acyl-CoA dehydrogenase family protein [Nocardia sp. NBC_01503]
MIDSDFAGFHDRAERWVRAQLPPKWLAAIESGDDGYQPEPDDPAVREWFGALAARGWTVPYWPREYGGAGLDHDHTAVVRAVLTRYRAELPGQYFVPVTLVGPGIMNWGSDEQRARYLPGIASGADMWCQLFSEPGAGSDLAGLSTRAEPTGDGQWIVHGQKVWSSFADRSRYGLLLARTDPDRPKNAGITCFLVDMRSPGVTTRPLRQLTGGSHFCEVFLDGVVIPDDARLGPVHEGWRVALSTLNAERSGLSGGSEVSGVALAPVLELARSSQRWREESIRDRLAGLYTTERALELTNLRLRAQARQSGPDAKGSITKLVQSELAQRIAEIGFELAGPGAAYWGQDAVAPAEDAAPMSPHAHALLDSRRLTIAGGTSEIQRNIIGERVLGLDREPDPDRGRPWRELRHG